MYTGELLVFAAIAVAALTLLMGVWLEWVRRSRISRIHMSLDQVDHHLGLALEAHQIVRGAAAEQHAGDMDLVLFLRQHPEAEDAAQEVLFRLQYLGIGVESGVLNARIVDRLAGSTILSMWLFYLPLLRFMRVRSNAPDLFKEFERLAYKLQGSRPASAEEADAFFTRWPSAERSGSLGGRHG